MDPNDLGIHDVAFEDERGCNDQQSLYKTGWPKPCAPPKKWRTTRNTTTPGPPNSHQTPRSHLRRLAASASPSAWDPPPTAVHAMTS